MRPFLELRGLVKDFGATRALDGLELAVGRGEIAVVLGPTGAGKTTLLRCIAGLERPDAGHVLLDGVDVTELEPAARDVALVFQNFALYPSWSVRRNLEFPLRAPGRNLDEGGIRAEVQRAAELLRIVPLLERSARQLSGGEMQRVAIGRAIVRRPKLFLMDEPLTNLDAKLRESLRVELALLARSLGTSMVYVTHDPAEALSMADRIAVLARGRLQQVGPPREVYDRPASAEVARQLGSPPINLIPVRRAGARWLAADGSEVAEARASDAAEALLGIRPEHLAPTGGRSRGRIELILDTGPVRVALVRWAGAQVHLVLERSSRLKAGDEVTPLVLGERLLRFPAG